MIGLFAQLPYFCSSLTFLLQIFERNMDDQQLRKLAPWAGIATCSLLYIVIIITAIPFHGQQGQSYSILNHFISELGSFNYSDYHRVYNTGLIIAACGFGIFIYGIKTYSTTKHTRNGMAVGLLSSALCVGVGLVPEDYRFPHLILALSFFSMMTVATAFFAWSIWKEKENPFPNYLAIHGFLVPISFTLFMMMPKGLMAVKRVQGAAFERPLIWWLPFLEWIIFFTFTSWIINMSIGMLRMQRAEKIKA